MKHHFSTMLLATFILLNVITTFSSCVNSITDEKPNSGSIPITLSTAIHTRVVNNTFEDNDTIGVYLLDGKKTLSLERYLNNIPFFSKSATTVSGETLYYPSGNNTCSFISYYPYKKNSIAEGSNFISFNCYTNQKEDKCYSHSDFLLAKTPNVTPGDKVVQLLHKHQFSLLKIIIQPSEGSSVNELLKANPEVRIQNTYTKCDYNIEEENISNLSARTDIMPHGSWSAVDGKLVGESAILIPQNIEKGTVLFNLKIEGRDFFCRLSSDFRLEGHKINTFTIPCSKWNVGGMQVSISEWEEGSSTETTLEPADGGISLSSLSFSKSNIYNVYNNNTLVARICKEYLSANNINSQAIVGYPVTNGEADLTKGIALKIGDTVENINGGTVAWDKTTNSLTYTAGNMASSIVYLNGDKQFVFEKPGTVLPVTLTSYMLVDIRDNETIRYPITKIATQYWMADNLATSKYNDGTAITISQEFSKGNTSPACYISSEGNEHYYFYNAGAVTGKIAPTDWHMPKSGEWTTLLNYLGGSTSKLKAGNWSFADGVTVSGISLFNGLAVGYVSPETAESTTGKYLNATYGASYWSLTDDGTSAKGANVVWYKTDTIKERNITEGSNGYSIRCIKN